MLQTFLACVFLAALQTDASRLQQEASEGQLADTESGDVRQWTPKILDMALDRMFEDVMVMQYVRREFKATDLAPHVAGGKKKKVALMFMTKDAIDQHDLWHGWLSEADRDAFSVYVHQYKRSSDAAAHQRQLWDSLGVHFIPEVKTGWGQLSGVEYALLWEALRDPLNAQFVFLSEGHVPLKSPGFVYDYLMQEEVSSKICFAQPRKSLSLKTAELNRRCYFKDVLQHIELPTTVHANGSAQIREVPGRVLRHHQWLVLSRTHAVDVVNYAEEGMRQHMRGLTRVKYEGGDPAMLGASDESFVATTLMLASEKKGRAKMLVEEELKDGHILSSCTTFVYWRNCWTGTVLSRQSGWNSHLHSDLPKIGAAAWKTHPSDWLDARKSPAKVLNDSPRNFGVTDSFPTKKHEDRYLGSLVKAGFLFARKFGLDEKGELSRDLSDVLPPLWKEWELAFGERTPTKMEKETLMWPVLDTESSLVQSSVKQRLK